MRVHLRDRNFVIDDIDVTKHALSSSVSVYDEAVTTFRSMGMWLCGVCFKTHGLKKMCRHGEGFNFLCPPDGGDGVVRFVLYNLDRPTPSVGPSFAVADLGYPPGVFDVGLLDGLLAKRLSIVKSIPPKCRLGFS